MDRDATLPTDVWDWVELHLPGVHRTIEVRPGGFTDGVRGRVRNTSQSAFLKAVPLNHAGAEDARIEAATLRALPGSVGAPGFIAFAEVAGWAATLEEFIFGEMPEEPWTDYSLAQVIFHLDAVHSDLVLSTPSLRPLADQLPTVGGRMAGRASTWSRLLNAGHTELVRIDDLDDWERDNLVRLAAEEVRAGDALIGESLVHFDLRHDNILLDTSDRIRLLDWGRACRGPAWVDVVCLLLESLTTNTDLDSIFRSSQLGASAREEDVDAFLVVLASYWRESSHQTVEVPAGLRRRRADSLSAATGWLNFRWSNA